MLTPFRPESPRAGIGRVIRTGLGVAFALALLAVYFTESIALAFAMFGGAAACIALALLWVQRLEDKSPALPPGALWTGLATVRVRDVTRSPLLDTVVVSRPALAMARHRPARGAVGDVVVDPENLTWTARWDAALSGVRGSFVLPWTAVVRAQAASIPTSSGSGAIALTFADAEKLDIAFGGNYPGFRAAISMLPRSLPGLDWSAN
ncbi:MAG: hypothetical protein ACRDZ8_15960 [Acidimicrobiales bacterium]